jgi:hypothetical protein
MASPTTALTAQFAAAIESLVAVSHAVVDYRATSDAELLELARLTAVQRQLVDSHAALVAGEVDRRSAPQLGHAGLAQRTGHRTPEELIRVTTRSTGREASSAVRAGRMVNDAFEPTGMPGSPEMADPWLDPIAAAVVAGALPLASADAIRNGLGAPSESVTADDLASAAALLCEEAQALDADRLFRRARQLRDELDESGVEERERERREKRSFRFSRLPDGMSRVVWMLDTESAAYLAALYDRVTSPRRGGPRFVDAALKTQADGILDDTRTTEQLASDVFLELLIHGADADDSELLGSGAPTIQVLVTAHDLAARDGIGFIEGQTDPISIRTVERITCTATLTHILFTPDGRPLDAEREQRLYNRRQKRVLAARDGGCMAPGCERPPSFTEAHHTRFWARDGGLTNIEDGILLCRHHHLLIHNNGWEIVHDELGFWLIPPPDIDPNQTPIAMATKSAALRRMVAQQRTLVDA